MATAPSRKHLCKRFRAATHGVEMVQKLNIPTLNGVQDAELRIESYTLQTPVHTSAELSSRVQESLSELATDKEDEDLLPDIKLFFKCENLQTTGSFKLRGACNFLLTLDDKTLRCGVITYSTGKPLHWSRL